MAILQMRSVLLKVVIAILLLFGKTDQKNPNESPEKDILIDYLLKKYNLSDMLAPPSGQLQDSERSDSSDHLKETECKRKERILIDLLNKAKEVLLREQKINSLLVNKIDDVLAKNKDEDSVISNDLKSKPDESKSDGAITNQKIRIKLLSRALKLLSNEPKKYRF